jgi:phage shock protein C
MYCTHCGKEVLAEAFYCPSCGGRQPGNISHRTLVRPLEGRKVGGVCLAFAKYLVVDPTLVRVICLVLAVTPPGVGLLAYAISWIVIPGEEPAPAGEPAIQVQSPGTN